jgi:hypothetical protein
MDQIFGELLKNLGYIPKYFVVLARLFLQPRASLAALPASDDEQLAPALMFLALSCAIMAFSTLPFAPAKESTVLFLAARAVVIAVMMIVYALAIHVSWRIVGGKETFLRCFILSIYISCVASLILLVFLLVGISTVVALDPDLGHAMMSSGLKPIPLDQSQFLLASIYLGAVFLGVIVASVWFTLAWGAFRDANQASRLRSFLAFCIAGVLALPILGVTALISVAIDTVAQRGGV